MIWLNLLIIHVIVKKRIWTYYDLPFWVHIFWVLFSEEKWGFFHIRMGRLLKKKEISEETRRKLRVFLRVPQKPSYLMDCSYKFSTINIKPKGKTELVHQTLEDRRSGISWGTIASKSPLNLFHSFFASLKKRLVQVDTSTRELKKKAFLRICKEYPPDVVRSYFVHCGWEIYNAKETQEWINTNE